jgi:hypothetical protein
MLVLTGSHFSPGTLSEIQDAQNEAQDRMGRSGTIGHDAFTFDLEFQAGESI